MLGNIETLHAIHSRCSADQPLTPELRTWLASALGRYLEHDCGSLNEAFGLIHGHGGVPWWHERAIRSRDAALRELARQHLARLSVHGRARRIATLSARYAATAWPRDRERREMPTHYSGTLKEHLWRAFRSGAKMPVSERRLRTLLAD